MGGTLILLAATIASLVGWVWAVAAETLENYNEQRRCKGLLTIDQLDYVNARLDAVGRGDESLRAVLREFKSRGILVTIEVDGADVEVEEVLYGSW